MKSRIKELRLNLKLTQEQFGAALGITKSTVSRIESGINSITEQTIKSIIREFSVNEEWLRYGSSKMYENNIFSLDDFAKQCNATNDELNFIKNFLSLSKPFKEDFIKLLYNR